jgi:signal transduction histidine kinase
MLDRALSITRIGLDETRGALRALRATPLEDMGLVLAIQSISEAAAERGALSLDLNLAQQLNHLMPEVEQCYYRVAQEALENVLKHAAAQHIAVSLRQEAGQLVLEVSDDGCGFPVTDVAVDGRLGIKGMRERAELIGAVLEIDSAPGEGTVVRLSSRGSL